ncbi:MAG: four helix bundle protein, partial [Acidobacteriota bacterium]
MLLSVVMGARDHQELDCWILADQVRQRTFAILTSGRLSAHQWLNTQLAKSSSSSCANIAEGFSRFNPKEFARHLTFAKASLSETIDHLASAFRPHRLFEEYGAAWRHPAKRSPTEAGPARERGTSGTQNQYRRTRN